MTPDPKPAKIRGTIKCVICKNRYYPAPSKHKWCSPECGATFALQQLDKKRELDRKADKKRLERERYEMKKPKDIIPKLTTIFNRLIREIDKNYPCIARPNENVTSWDAGHYYSTGSVPALRFWAHNVHKQSTRSNKDLGGEPLLYREGLIERYGPAYVESLEQARKKYTKMSWTKEQLEYANLECRAMLRELSTRVITREEINKRLKLYEI